MVIKKNFLVSSVSVLLLIASLATIGIHPAEAAITLTFVNNATPDTSGTNYQLLHGTTGTVFNQPFGVGEEFRMISTFGTIGGGGEK